MKITLDISKAEAEIICEALNDWRALQQRLSIACNDSNPRRFTKRIKTAFVIESMLQDIIFGG
jgi:hypothetical protein